MSSYFSPGFCASGGNEVSFLMTILFPFIQQGVHGTPVFLRLNIVLQLLQNQKMRHILELALVLLHRNGAGEKIKACAISENRKLQCCF